MPRAERPAVGGGFGGEGRVLYAACALSQFLVAVGASVVTTMGPALREANGLRASWLPWAVLVYALALGLLALPLRLLIRHIRPLPVLILGLWLFVQSSVALTLVSGAPAFLAFRAVQGVGAAALTATAFALVLALDLDGQRSDRLLLAWSAVVVAGLGAGLVVGAVVGAEWRWALWANVPLTATAGVPLVRLLRSTRRRDAAVGAGTGAGAGAGAGSGSGSGSSLGDGGGAGGGDGDGVGVGQGDGAQDAAA